MLFFFFVRLRMRREAACHREHHLLHRHRQEQEQPPGRREPSSCLFHARETFLHDVRIRQQPLRGPGGRESLPGERGVAFVSRVVWRTLVFRESSRLKREPVWSVAGFGLCVSWLGSVAVIKHGVVVVVVVSSGFDVTCARANRARAPAQVSSPPIRCLLIFNANRRTRLFHSPLKVRFWKPDPRGEYCEIWCRT